MWAELLRTGLDCSLALLGDFEGSLPQLNANSLPLLRSASAPCERRDHSLYSTANFSNLGKNERTVSNKVFGN